jgi:hypothetical protein
MPVRKKKKTSRALARRTTSAIATLPDLGDEYAEVLNRDRATAKATGWDFIRTRGTGWKWGEDPLPNPFEAIIVAAMRVNTYYTGAFDPNSFSAPTCYAYAADGMDETAMAPPDSLATKENADCGTCIQNAFGSGQGRGKACKNQIKLAVLCFVPGCDDYGDTGKAKGLVLTLPPASIKEFAAYSEKITSEGGLNRALFTVVTQLEKDDSGTGFKINASLVEPIQSAPILKTIMSRTREGYKTLQLPPPTGSAEEATPKRTTRRRKVS